MVSRSLVLASSAAFLVFSQEATAVGCLRDNVSIGMTMSPDGTCRGMSPNGNSAAKNALQTRDIDPETSEPMNSYADGWSQMKNPLVSPRKASNEFCAQEEYEVPENRRKLSALWIYFGQFIDHDFTIIHTDSSKSAPISLPDDEQIFTQPIDFHRSYTDSAPGEVNEYPNGETSTLDLSTVYGDDLERQMALRTREYGRLKTSVDGSLPKNSDIGIDMAGGDFQYSGDYLACGDVRCNENPILLAFHDLFVREHNRLADTLWRILRIEDDEELFQLARMCNVIQYQKIIWNDWLPELLGHKFMAEFMPESEDASDAEEDLSMSLPFSTVSYRFGHSMIPEHVQYVNSFNTLVKKIRLKEGFFNPSQYHNKAAELLNGARLLSANDPDTKVTPSLRNDLFVEHQSNGKRLDLCALNLHRQMDNGVPGLNSMRRAMELPEHTSWADVTSNPEMQTKLSSNYGPVPTDDAHAWVVGMAEDPYMDGILGETFAHNIGNQFAKYIKYDMYSYHNFLQICAPFCDTLMRRVIKPDIWAIVTRNFVGAVRNKFNAFHVSPVYPSEVRESFATIRWSPTRGSYKGGFIVEVIDSMGTKNTHHVAPGEHILELTGLASGMDYRVAVYYIRLLSNTKGRMLGEVSIRTLNVSL